MRRRVIGPRTLVEGAFLIAVPIVVGVVIGAGFWTIIAASGVAYLLIVLVEAFLWYDARSDAPLLRRRAQPAAPAPAPVLEPEPESVVVLPAAAPPEHVRVLEPEPEPEPAPEPAAEPEPEPVPVPAPLAAVPDPEPEPEPVAPPPPAPAPNVVPIGAGSLPSRWNLWDLERLARDHAGGDVARDEERTFILMYLREFADADGMLPVDFDGLVRDSFGELVGVR